MPKCTAKEQKVLKAGIEPATFCVLSRRHNQLDHSSASGKWKNLLIKICSFRYLGVQSTDIFGACAT
jgi:hypothetical protein